MPETAVIPNPEKANAEVAQKLADQDISGQPTVTGDFSDANSALDKLAEAASKPPVAAPPVPEVVPADEEAAKKKAEEDAAAAKKVEDERAAQLKKSEDYFKDTPSLPPGASPKSAEAFASVKIKAAQEISAREAELDKIKKELADLKEKSGKPTPEQEQTAKELEEHRAWRAKLDVEFDPKFKEYDKQVASAHEFIYDQLRKSPAVTDEVIDQIKKYGGPENVNLVKLFETIKDPSMQRLIESKVADIEQVKWAKTQAIKAAKENITGYISEREKQWQESATRHTQATQTTLNELLGNLDWFAEKKADEPDAIEHNKFVGELKNQIAAAVQDDSPQMRAILITGMAQLFRLQKLVPAKDAEIASLKKELAETKEKWEKIKNGSVSRLRESAAPPSGQMPKKEADIFNSRPQDALDAIAKQVSEERAAKAA